MTLNHINFKPIRYPVDIPRQADPKFDDWLQNVLKGLQDFNQQTFQPDIGTEPGDLVALDENGKLPAIDGSQLTNVGTAAGYKATSTTSLTVGTGSKTFTTNTSNLAYQAGTRARAAYSSGTGNFMEGVVTSFSGTTLVINVDNIGGSGTYASWNINCSGSQGATGATGYPGVIYGTAVPTTEGVDGEFYIRTTTNYIYGPKAGGVWPAGTSLVGPQGSSGLPGSGYQTAFANVNIDGSGDLTVTHGLNFMYVTVQIFDNNNKIITPDYVLLIDANSFKVRLASFGTLTGTWNVVATAGGATPYALNPAPADHTPSGFTTTLTAGENLLIGDLCYCKSDGKMWKADADASSSMPAYAMSTGTIAANASGSFLLWGYFKDLSWSWTVGGLIYTSGTAGGMTQTVPSTAGQYIEPVAVAISAGIIFFSPSLSMSVVPAAAYMTTSDYLMYSLTGITEEDE